MVYLNHKSRSFWVRRGVPQGSVLVPVLFSLFINDLLASLLCSVSCSLYADDLAIWSSSPSVPTAVEATQGALFRLERWLEYWCFLLNPSKCEASFFSVDPHQANLQPNLLLFNSSLCFNPTPTFLGVTFDRTKSFLRPLLIYASSGRFPFLSVINITKLERLHRAASRAISGCLSSSPIPLLLSEASLPPLRVTLTHFTLSSYKRKLRSPNLLFHFRFGQTWSETKTADRPGELLRPLTRSWFLLLVLGRFFLLALPVLPGTCLPSLWSPPFPLHALDLIPSLSTTLTLSPLS